MGGGAKTRRQLVEGHPASLRTGAKATTPIPLRRREICRLHPPCRLNHRPPLLSSGTPVHTLSPPPPPAPRTCISSPSAAIVAGALPSLPSAPRGRGGGANVNEAQQPASSRHTTAPGSARPELALPSQQGRPRDRGCELPVHTRARARAPRSRPASLTRPAVRWSCWSNRPGECSSLHSCAVYAFCD